DRLAFIAGPSPVRAAIANVGEPPDLRIQALISITPCRGRHNTGQKQGGINQRKLTFPDPTPGFHVEEVIVKSLVPRSVRVRALRAVSEETQGGEGELRGMVSFHPP